MAYRKRYHRNRGLSVRAQNRNKKSAHKLVKKLLLTKNPRSKRRIARAVHKKIKYS